MNSLCLQQIKRLGLLGSMSAGLMVVTASSIIAAPAAFDSDVEHFNHVSSSLAQALVGAQQIEPPRLVAQAQPDVVDAAIAAGSFQILIGLFDELGMADDLRGYGRFTLFAPTDSAFADVPEDIMQTLLDNRELMARVLAYHVITARTPLLSGDVTSPLTLRTLERSNITLARRSGSLVVNNAQVTRADIEASNGVIHAIDAVLIPDDVLAEIGATP